MGEPSPQPDENQVEALLAELERLQSQFDDLKASLTHSHRLATLGTLASAVAHEYNNVLTPVINYAQMGLNRPDDPELMQKALQKCLEGTRRATRISSSLLGFAQQDEEAEVAHLPETVDEALACLARNPEKEGITIAREVPALAVAISPLNLQQVLVNLLLNAKKAMRTTGGRVTLRGYAFADDQVRLEIADTGPGIPPAIQERLFEPFVTQPHGQKPESDYKTGTGLGLSICRDLVTGAGGSIDVSSEEGRGTTFYLTLPRAERAAHEKASSTPEEAEEAA